MWRKQKKRTPIDGARRWWALRENGLDKPVYQLQLSDVGLGQQLVDVIGDLFYSHACALLVDFLGYASIIVHMFYLSRGQNYQQLGLKFYCAKTEKS